MFGKNKCQHKWIEITRRFTPPVARINNVKVNSSKYIEIAERSLYGYTTIEQRCEICESLKFTVAKGNQIDG